MAVAGGRAVLVAEGAWVGCIALARVGGPLGTSEAVGGMVVAVGGTGVWVMAKGVGPGVTELSVRGVLETRVATADWPQAVSNSASVRPSRVLGQQRGCANCDVRQGVQAGRARSHFIVRSAHYSRFGKSHRCGERAAHLETPLNCERS